MFNRFRFKTVYNKYKIVSFPLISLINRYYLQCKRYLIEEYGLKKEIWDNSIISADNLY